MSGCPSTRGQIYCFCANYERSQTFDRDRAPDWLEVRANWQGYRISTLPWIADVARTLGLLPLPDTPEAWISHLETLGLQEVRQMSCEEFYSDSLFW